ncbi:MAG: hypothetical protein ACPG7F_01335 [Aggregatilineales bacterium]
MGTDIHGWIEIQFLNKWWDVVKIDHIVYRNHNIFEAISGVSNSEDQPQLRLTLSGYQVARVTTWIVNAEDVRVEMHRPGLMHTPHLIDVSSIPLEDSG